MNTNKINKQNKIIVLSFIAFLLVIGFVTAEYGLFSKLGIEPDGSEIVALPQCLDTYMLVSDGGTWKCISRADFCQDCGDGSGDDSGDDNVNGDDNGDGTVEIQCDTIDTNEICTEFCRYCYTSGDATFGSTDDSDYVCVNEIDDEICVDEGYSYGGWGKECTNWDSDQCQCANECTQYCRNCYTDPDGSTWDTECDSSSAGLCSEYDYGGFNTECNNYVLMCSE